MEKCSININLNTFAEQSHGSLPQTVFGNEREFSFSFSRSKICIFTFGLCRHRIIIRKGKLCWIDKHKATLAGKTWVDESQSVMNGRRHFRRQNSKYSDPKIYKHCTCVHASHCVHLNFIITIHALRWWPRTFSQEYKSRTNACKWMKFRLSYSFKCRIKLSPLKFEISLKVMRMLYKMGDQVINRSFQKYFSFLSFLFQQKLF